MLIETALAPVPDLSVLRELEPGVAYLALVVVLVTVVLFYVGPALRSRLMRAADRPDPPAGSPDAPALTTTAEQAQLPAVIDRADAVYERFIAHLLEQLDDRDRELEARDVQQKRMEQQLALLADENARLRARKPWRAE